MKKKSAKQIDTKKRGRPAGKKNLKKKNVKGSFLKIGNKYSISTVQGEYEGILTNINEHELMLTNVTSDSDIEINIDYASTIFNRQYIVKIDETD
jgi:hypothetical protein